ncbi:MAG: hypothetical protein ACK4KV_15075 [Rhodocyclaceae bacterium]
MLTEIEWWGGLLFIWGALSYRALALVGLEEVGLARVLLARAMYLCVGVVLAVYFYPLNADWARLGYIGATALAALLVLGFSTYAYGWTDDEEGADTPGVTELGWTVAGHFALLGPVLIGLILAGWKSYGLFHGQG